MSEMNARSRIVHRITDMMHERDPGKNPVAARLLTDLSRVYGGAARIRAAAYAKGILRHRTLPCTVISIGNLTVGGTGKTPMTLYMARLLQRLGYRVAVASRGYRGKAEKTGGVVSDGRRIFMGPDTAGDEPYMMAVNLPSVPVVVGRNRYVSGMAAIHRFSPQVLLLDDAFQHYQLHRDLNVALLDGRRPFGNHHLVPRGILREPVAALGRANVFVFTRSEPSGVSMRLSAKRRLPDRPVFTSRHRPVVYRRADTPRRPDDGRLRPPELIRSDVGGLKGRSVFAFSGIADNDDFRRTVSGLCKKVTGFKGFPDHHDYSGADLEGLAAAARASGAETLATTEKDHARMGHRIRWAGDLSAIGIEVDFGRDTDAFEGFVRGWLERMKSASAAGAPVP